MTTTPFTDIHGILPFYRTGQENLAEGFFKPCLSQCLSYRRAAGYFSSTALKTWSSALMRLLEEKVSIQLLISPELSQQDSNAFKVAVDDHAKALILEQMSERLIEEALLLVQDPDDVQRRLSLMTWMIVAGQLEIRFAIPKHIEDAGIFHDKSGIFLFPNGEKIAFLGSANETISGHVLNYEKIHVFRNWHVEDLSRIKAIESDFENLWWGGDDHLLVAPLSPRSLKLIKERAPIARPTILKPIAPKKTLNQWRHQDEAESIFLKEKFGVLEMATGTGKTNTTLKILNHLFGAQKISGAIIATEGTDLLDQWSSTLVRWNIQKGLKITVLRHYEKHHQGQVFSNNPSESILVISRQQLAATLRQLSIADRESLIIVHDEVHGLGAPQCVAELKGLQQEFSYRLGLSATPEREYDDAGSKFIEEEVGKVIYEFGLKEAIERGILCEFDYVPLTYELTEDDKKRLSAVYSKKAAREKAGNPMSKEEFWTELARVYKTAEQKPYVFADYLKAHPNVIKGTIIFVEDRNFGERVLPLLDKYTHLYRTYYAADDRENLIKFGRGEIDVLLTCHRISQGIDIRDLQAVILFSASRARLETIQRIGRCLRSDPNDPAKRALVIDFVRHRADSEEENADELRMQWLTELSTTTRKE